MDDVLDVTQNSSQLGKTAGKDVASEKATWPAVYGVDQSVKDAERLIDEAFTQLDQSMASVRDRLKAVARYLVERQELIWPSPKKTFMQALRDCYDPEIPVNIVDLGLIYKVTLTPDANSKRAFPRQRVEVEMTMTSQGCPAHVMIIEQVRNRLAGIPEISETLVNLVWEPAWTPDRISQKAREQLGIG